MRLNIKRSTILGLMLTATSSLALADATPVAPVDFNKTVLPILQSSCFACHVKGAAVITTKDPDTLQHIQKTISHGIDGLTMGDKFPFPDGDNPGKQLKHMEKELSKNMMPPRSQAKLGLGAPLSDKDRKTLLLWVAQQEAAK